MNFVPYKRETARHPQVFRLTGTRTGAYEQGQFRGPIGYIRPDYRVMFEGIQEALRREMKIVFTTSSRAALHELSRFLQRSNGSIIARDLGSEFVPARGPSSPKPFFRFNIELMECWGL